MPRPARPIALLALALLSACPEPEMPPGVECSRVTEADDDLQASLDSARPGDCVVPEEGTYQGAFKVPSGVRLVAAVGTKVKLSGSEASSPALTIAGGEGSAAVGVEVTSPVGNGLLVDGAPALVQGVSLSMISGTALLAACREGDTACAANPITVRDAVITNAIVGLWAYRANVKVEGGQISGCSATTLAGGYGAVASHGASLDMTGTLVNGNQEVGVLVDGALGTSAALTDLKVKDNQGRGIWLQGIDGTEANPKVRIQGAGTLVEGNRIVGVGMREARGIIIINGRIANTEEVLVPADGIGEMRAVGDGIGAFQGTGAVRVEGVELSGNKRSQVLVDHGERGIIIINGKISLGGGRYLVVVQNTVPEVEASPSQLSEAGETLAVSSGAMGLATPQ